VPDWSQTRFVIATSGDISQSKISFGDGDIDNVELDGGNINQSTITFGDGAGDVIGAGGSA
jgi:hypothetical protein